MLSVPLIFLEKSRENSKVNKVERDFYWFFLLKGTPWTARNSNFGEFKKLFSLFFKKRVKKNGYQEEEAKEEDNDLL